MKLSKACLALVVPLALVWACGSSSTGDSTGGGADGAGANGSGANGSGADGSGATLAVGGDAATVGGDGATTGGTTVGTGGTTVGTGGTVTTDVCEGASCTCSNGMDDDGDGLVDGFDPECTGPLDNDEGSFATGIPGDNRDPKWQDCFFDGNSGAGDDHCRYATGCLTGDLDQDDPDCSLTKDCIDFCAKLTPNGCDCFGCCTVQLPNGDTTDIETGIGCSLDNIDDEMACPKCVKSDACGNTCGRCELCPGKTIEDLPDDCGSTGGTGGTGTGGTGTGGTGTGGTTSTGGGPTYTCDGGEQVCGPDLPSCGLGKYCSLGCCLYQPPK
jgi:hypothetical protein